MNYAYSSEAYEQFAIEATESARGAFIRRTYAHLFGAVLAFIGLEAVILNTGLGETILRALWGQGGMWSMLFVVGGFMVTSMIAQHWAHSSASTGMQYAGLGLYVAMESVFLAPALVLGNFLDPNIVPISAIVTLLIFGGLSAIVLITGANFSFLRTGLMFLGWAAFATIIAGIVMGFSLGLWFCVAMAALMCGYILYDTSNVLHHYRCDQHVGAALELFSSLATLFYYVLRIAMYLYARSDD